MDDGSVVFCQRCGKSIKVKPVGRRPKTCKECVKDYNKELRREKDRTNPTIYFYAICPLCKCNFGATHKNAKYYGKACHAKANGIAKRKFKQTIQCAFCGSVSVPTKTTQQELRRDPNYRAYCDIECANEAKKFAYRSEGYREKIGWHETRIRQAAEAKRLEVEREKTRKAREKEQWKACGWCWNSHNSVGYYCSEQCRYERYLNALVLQRLSSVDWSKAKCKECGNQIPKKKGRKPDGFCSDRCGNRHRKRNREHRKRAQSIPGTSISMAKLRSKYKDKCVSCGVVCVKATSQYNPNAATIDHIIPLSKGGMHIESNVQLMCHRCNGRKSDSIPAVVQQFLPW